MSLKLNGTSGVLTHAARIITGYPASMMMWVAIDGSGSNQFLLAQGSSSQNRAISALLLANGTNLGGYIQAPAGSAFVQASTAVLPSVTQRLLVVVFNSASSMTVYFGSTASASSGSLGATDDLTTHNRVTLGAIDINGGGPGGFTNGSIAEAHFFSVALTSTDVDNLLADTVKPEAISGWIDGWTLKDHAADGTYTSLGGSRTLTASGGVTTSAQPHPIARTLSTALSGTVTLDNGVASGSLATLAGIAGTVALDDGMASGALGTSGNLLTGTANLDAGVSSGAFGHGTGTIVSQVFKSTTTKLPIASTSFAHAVLLPVGDPSAPVSVPAPSVDSDGRMTVESAGLVPGSDYMLAVWNADGSSGGIQRVTAA